MIETNPPISPPSPQAAREVRRNSSMRQARTCYDHLAGVAGVELMDVLLRRGWLESAGQVKGRTHFKLTAEGGKALLHLGVDLFPKRGSKRRYAYGCVDWTERRFHLGGGLGAAILAALCRENLVRRDQGARKVALLAPIAGWLDSDSS